MIDVTYLAVYRTASSLYVEKGAARQIWRTKSGMSICCRC